MIPEKLKTETPVLIAPGWGETIETFRGSIISLANEGRRTLSIRHPRFGKISQPPQESLSIYPKFEFTKALNLLAVLKQKGITKTDIVAHSEGAINAAIAATMNSEQFRSLVLVAPGGIMPKQDTNEIIERLWLNLEESLKRATKDPKVSPYLIRSGIETAKYILQNPPRALLEAIDALGKSDIVGMLKPLREQGIKVAIISGVDDPAVPMVGLQEITKRDQIDGFYSIKGSHHDIYTQPEKYMKVVDEVLTTLNKESSERQV